MPISVVKTQRDEEKWDRAKEIASKAGQGENYAYIMGIYKRMKPDHRFSKISSVTAKTLRGLKDKPDEFADLVNMIYRSKGVAPGSMHTRQFLDKGGRVPDESVESVIRSLR